MAFENLKSTGIAYLLTRLKEYFVQIKDAVKSVNNIEPDNHGNITIDEVPYANDLISDRVQTSRDKYLIRTTGGRASIKTGDAWLMRLIGNSVHEGYVAEEIVPTTESTNISNPTVVRDTFVSKVAQSGTTVFTYSNNAWSPDVTTYGVSYTGTPAEGDTISVSYVKEVPGTIYQSCPTKFVSTNWNLYNNTEGYAHVIKYDDEQTFRIEGTYTSIKFSTTASGTGTAITVTDGNFDPFLNTDATEGYVKITGGNSSDTAIYMTWGNWTEEANGGVFEAYDVDEIDLSNLIGDTNEDAPFPYGLLNVGSVSDEINLNLGTYTKKVERLDNTTENLATAKASGREYEYDEQFIYLALETPETGNLEDELAVDGAFHADDHGMEYFVGSEVPVEAMTMYGNNLKEKLESDVVTFSENVYNDLDKTAEGFVLDARQGKALSDKFSYQKGDYVYFPTVLWGYASSASAIRVYFATPKFIPSGTTFTVSMSSTAGRDMDGNAISASNGTVSVARALQYSVQIDITGWSGLTSNKAYRITTGGNRAAQVD